MSVLMMMTKKRFLILILIFAFSSIHSFGQNRKELEDRRKRLILEISQTTNLLNQTKQNKKVTLNRYLTLQRQIKKRLLLVKTLKAEINYIEASVLRTNEVMAALNSDIDRLKSEYGQMIRTAYRLKRTNSTLLFLFSAKNLNDAFKRWQYIRQYDKYRKKQARLIADTQEMLAEKSMQLASRRTEKENLLASAERQRSLLGHELKDKDRILESLKTNEVKLVQELDKQQESHEKLNNAIERIIRSEIAVRKKQSRSSEALAVTASKKETVNLTGDFKNNKGGLPWPVTSGFITRKFGTQPHPTLKEIEITNNGIDIQTEKKADVRAVFDGKVAGTQFIPGYQNTIILQHGSYYTVYSNLEEIFVKRGDIVKVAQAIGRVGKDKAEVHFEVWQEKQRLNPINWVSKR